MKNPRKNHKPERNKKIAAAILQGNTLASQADKFNLSTERIRKLVHLYCSAQNRTAYHKALVDSQLLSDKHKQQPSIYHLRSYSEYFK
jgi:hypothetical protein